MPEDVEAKALAGATMGYSYIIEINEAEAEQDVRNIEEAIAKISMARALLNPGKIQDENMLGNTRTTLDEQMGKFCKELEELETTCRTTGKFIRSTVEKYKKLDRELLVSRPSET